MKFGICNEIFQDWPLADAFACASEVGYDCVEIAPFTIAKSVMDISASERQRIKDLAVEKRIAISGIHWVLVQTEGLHLTHSDAAVRARTARYFVDLVDFCGDLGGTRIVVGSPKQRSLQPGVSYEQAWEHATNVFRDSIRRAEERDIVICFEPLAPSETDFVNTAAEGIRFAQQFNSPAMSIILDVKAMSSEGKPVSDIIRESAGKFEYFHANDPNLKGPGFGDTDFGPIARALRDAKYNGVVSVEVFKFEEGAKAIASQSLEYLRKTFAE
jgi:sugar phosphate isomerase/epimerase